MLERSFWIIPEIRKSLICRRQVLGLFLFDQSGSRIRLEAEMIAPLIGSGGGDGGNQGLL
jgi:hypothetical protein